MKSAVKMDVDSVDHRVESGQRQPVEKFSLVDVNQLKSTVWSKLTSRKVQFGQRLPRKVQWLTSTQFFMTYCIVKNVAIKI